MNVFKISTFTALSEEHRRVFEALEKVLSTTTTDVFMNMGVNVLARVAVILDVEEQTLEAFRSALDVAHQQIRGAKPAEEAAS